MQTRPYQLTKHPVGSIKEIWSLSYPLMLSYLSISSMLFIDRLLLARYSLDAMNACANAGMAGYVFMVLPMMIGSIAEVFAGQLHGSGQKEQMGVPIWQMLWFCLFLAPLFFSTTLLFPSLLFQGTGNEALEIDYFCTYMYGGSFFCASLVLAGFFIAKGEVAIVTYAMIIGNLTNIGLDFPLIFGWGPIPSLGVFGAALATCASQIASSLFLFLRFLNAENRHTYGTTRWRFERHSFLNCLRVGVPNGLAHFSEYLAHFAFFRLMIQAGGPAMTIATICAITNIGNT